MLLSAVHRGPIRRMHGMALRRSQIRVIMSGLLNWILHMERRPAIIIRRRQFLARVCHGAVIALSQLSHCQLCVCCWEKGLNSHLVMTPVLI